MQLVKKGIVRSLLWSLPFAILALYQGVSGNTDAVHAMLVYAGVAFFLGLTSVVYEVRQWSFKKQIFIHWSVMHVTILPLLWFGGSTPVTSLQDAVRLYLNFTVSGLILFTLSVFHHPDASPSQRLLTQKLEGVCLRALLCLLVE